jgi:putative ATPase
LAALQSSLEFNEEAKSVLLHMADGDARRFLNLIEQTFNAAKTSQVSKVTAEFLEQSLGHLSKRFDKSGDHFYDQISALHKSVRGSNSDGALYWFCRMIDGGVDVKYLSQIGRAHV